MSTFRSFAKLNLHLEVAGRRADGYHELRTLFSTIDLADELEIELTAGGVTLETGRADLPAGRENLVVRAAEAFLAAVGGGVGARIRLLKRIPVGGGLGGGSANAATTLRGLALMTGSGPSEAELERIARSLGADVPFFLHGGLALGLGQNINGVFCLHQGRETAFGVDFIPPQHFIGHGIQVGLFARVHQL